MNNSQHTVGKRPQRSHFSGGGFLAVLLAGLMLSACSKEEEKPQVETKPSKVIEVTSSQGIEIKEHSPMPQAPEPLRKLTAVAEGTPAPKLEGEGLMPPPADAKAISPGGADGTTLKLQDHLKPQTPSMRLEARNNAMAEMIRVRKAEQPAAQK